MEESNYKKTSYHDLEELVSLAEKISLNIKSLDDRLFRLRLHQFLSLLFVYVSLGGLALIFTYSYKMPISLISSVGLGILCIAMGVVAVIAFTTRSRIRKQYTQEMQGEVRALRSLMTMTYELKESLDNGELGIVSSALIDLKLSRIDFSGRYRAF